MKTTKEKCAADRVFPWLRANYGRAALAPLTGTDRRALAAFVQVLELAAGRAHVGHFRALAVCALDMQPSTVWLARSAIPMVLDWSDEFPLWKDIAASHPHGTVLLLSALSAAPRLPPAAPRPRVFSRAP